MKFFINRLRINGIKSLDKEIVLNFSNATLKPKYDYSKSNVKAIYGPNGSGKSGIMSALYIYKEIMQNNNGINAPWLTSLIRESINQSTKKLSFEIVFSNYLKDNTPICYKHYLEISNTNKGICITKEALYELKGRIINDEYFKEIYRVEDGILRYLAVKGNIEDEPVYKYSVNLLDKCPLVVALSKLNASKAEEGNDDVFCALAFLFLFTFDLVVELSKEDTHMSYFSRKSAIEKFNKLDINNPEDTSVFVNNVLGLRDKENIILPTPGAELVDRTEYNEYKKELGDLLDFIKIFKPSLISIDDDCREYDENNYLCKKIFIYKEAKIDLEFESTGIKKLVSLYNALKACANGKVVFIDEMDANLHDVYFTKLIEFFKYDGKGQLCFTTHNLEPIEILKSNKHSLDFLSNDSRIASWIKDGNKSPMSKYVNGLIPYSPFLVKSMDFDLLLDGE